MEENKQINQTNLNTDITVPTKKINSIDKMFVDKTRAAHASFLHKYKRIIISSICLFFILFSLTTIPYTGQYLDAFVFEYFFGQAKYLIYLWLIILCICIMCKAKFIKQILSLRGILIQIFFILGFCIIISSVDRFIHSDIWHSSNVSSNELANCFVSYHTKHFWEYVIRTNIYNYHGNTEPWWMNTFFRTDEAKQASSWIITGGIIGEIFVDLADILLIIAGCVLILTGLYYISTYYPNNKFWKGINWFFNKIMPFKHHKFNDQDNLIPQTNDVKVKKTDNDSLLVAAKDVNVITPPISFLTDTSSDYYQNNKIISQQILKSINKYISQYNLNIQHVKTIIMPLFTEIHFTAASQVDIDTFIKNDLDLSLYTKLNEFNISYKKSELRFEYKNKKPSKVSLRSVLASTNIEPNTNQAMIGLSYGNDPLQINLKQNPNILVMGYKGSGCSMLLSVILMSYAYLNTPNLNQYDLICKNKDNVIATQFFNLPHLNKIAIYENMDNSIADLIKSYYDEIKNRQHDFEVISANNIDEYNHIVINNKSNEIMKRWILVFNDFNEIMYNDYHYTNMLNNILTEGSKYGIHIIINADGLSKELKDPLIYDSIDTKLVLKLKTETESQDIFNNYYGVQLYGNGDGYIMSKDHLKYLRFQACYLNQAELTNNINIINTFYKNKE